MTTVGDYLKSKMGNCCAWLRAELGQLPALDDLEALGPLKLVYAASELKSRASVVYARDWYSLNSELAGAPLATVADQVQLRPDMHDKFWRYLELFVESVE